MNYNANLKKKLRQSLLEKRKLLTQPEIKDLSQRVFLNLNKEFGIAFFKNLPLVSGYMAFDHELDIFTIMTYFNNNGVKTALPKIHDDGIKFHEWNENFPLIKNSLGIDEPKAGVEAIPKVILVPLVGFDKNRNRLGLGYGHYDKKLCTMPNSIKIGIGYSLQEVDQIPIEDHDVKLDHIITDRVCY